MAEQSENGQTVYLCLEGWAGRRMVPAILVGQTAKRFRIRLAEGTNLPGGRWARAGQIVLVPKWAVKTTEARQPGPQA